MYPITICRHYSVEWLDSHTCSCYDCGKQGHWMEDGFVVWVKGTRPATPYVKEANAAGLSSTFYGFRFVKGVELNFSVTATLHREASFWAVS